MENNNIDIFDDKLENYTIPTKSIKIHFSKKGYHVVPHFREDEKKDD